MEQDKYYNNMNKINLKFFKFVNPIICFFFFFIFHHKVNFENV